MTRAERARALVDEATLVDVATLVRQSEGLLAQARALLEGRIARDPGRGDPSGSAAGRVARLGEVAHRHLEFIETYGSMTRADSLRIRRELFGDSVRSTANLFGRRESGALFWRNRPYGAPVRDDDPIELTDEGRRIAELWRAARQS